MSGRSTNERLAAIGLYHRDLVGRRHTNTHDVVDAAGRVVWTGSLEEINARLDEREWVAAFVADTARRYEEGPSADDAGSAFRVLHTLARHFGYEGPIEPANRDEIGATEASL